MTFLSVVKARKAGRESARTAATMSELISLLRNKLEMSSALVVPEQDQAMMDRFRVVIQLG